MATSRLLTIAAVAAMLLTAAASASAKTAHQNKLSAIEKMVDDGKLPEAVNKLQQDYKFDNPTGLNALYEFSLKVLRRGLRESDPFERCFAASALGSYGDKESVKILEAAFASPDPALKVAATDDLAQMNNAVGVEVLERLYHTSDSYGRRLAVQGLSQIDAPQAKRVLVMAVGESDNATRLLAAEALGRMKDYDAIPQLRRLLTTEKEPFNKVTVAHSLLLLGDNSGLPVLVSALGDTANSNRRAGAALALADARDTGAQKALQRALGDPNIEVQMAAGAALTHYNDGAGMTVIRTALESDDKLTRDEAGQLLAHMNYAVAHDVFASALSSSDPGLRMASTHALGMIGTEHEIGMLTNSLRQTNDPLMRADIAWALGKIGSPGSIPTLMNMVAEPDPAVRYTAADALARTSSKLLNHSAAARK